MNVSRLNKTASSLDENSRCSPLAAIVPGPTQILRSSSDLHWKGILLEMHWTTPGNRVSGFIEPNVISMLTGSSARMEYRFAGGRFVERVSRSGSIMITPSGEVPEMRLHTGSKFVHCALDQVFMCAVAEEMDQRPVCQPAFHVGLEDKLLRRILVLLTEELVADRPLGSLFVDSLAHALASRFLLLDATPRRRGRAAQSRLPLRILRRVQDKIEANLDTDLSLNSLAAESGYSRAHFLRMFRAATGLTPHQYVLDLRVRRAQEYLRGKAKIVDVAMSCGFSSQSHMTTVFRQRLEMTPSDFRRSA